MSASTVEAATKHPGAFSRWLSSVSRNEVFGAVFIVACANGLLGRAIQSISFEHWEGAISGIDVNAIVLFACYAGVSTVLGEAREKLSRTDLIVAVLCLGLASLPVYPLSWVAVTILSLYLLFIARGADRRRGALILLAVTVPMLWSRLLFQLFGKVILDIDAILISTLLGTDRSGNMVGFLDGSGHMVVLPACSSLANMSLAFLCWVSVTQWAKHQWSATDLFWSALACASVIAVNVTRISLMGLSRAHYELIHSEWGDMVVNTIMLVLMVGFSVLGARREIFTRV